ncbi:ARM repeat-containing protein [Xylariaceae sp. FL0594]|nr:ARM repeat-containing protein [Xylariaceae sp. FL0594]
MQASSNNEGFAGSNWQTGPNIWANGAGSVDTPRDAISSRGSEEQSPTAPSRSSQLHGLPVPSTSAWRFHNPASASPSRSNHRRLAGGIHGLSSITRTGRQGHMATNTETDFAYLAEDMLPPGDDRNRRVKELTTHAGLAVPRRNSADPIHASLGTYQSGVHGQLETPVSALENQYRPRTLYGGATNNLRPQPRASLSNYSNRLSDGFPLELANRAQSLTLDDASELTNGCSQVNEPLPFNPSLQAWNEGTPNHSARHPVSHGTPQDTWAGSPLSLPPTVRNAPENNSHARALNSPGDISLNQSSQFSSSIAAHDCNRQQSVSQFAHPSSIYPPQSFYPPNVPQFQPRYEQYTPSLAFPHTLPRTGFVAPRATGGLQIAPDRGHTHPRVSQHLAEYIRDCHISAAKRWELKDIRNHVVEFCGDQQGSRFIQDKLKSAKSEEKEWVFLEIERDAVALMKDLFGNYVIQKFYEHGNQGQKKRLTEMMRGKVACLSKNSYACRVVQAALDIVLVDQKHAIVDELIPCIVDISQHDNGNHVIQKVVAVLPTVAIPCLLKAFGDRIEEFSKHKLACRVVQRMLEFGTPEEKKSLTTDLHPCAARLVTDKFGNYVVQHIIEHGDAEDRDRMIELLTKRAVEYSKHKFASNVVEMAIKCGSLEQRRAIRDKFNPPAAKAGDKTPLEDLIMDSYGNYPIQRLLDYLEEDTHFRDEVKRHLINYRQSGSGRGPPRPVLALEKKLFGGPALGHGVNGNNGINGINGTNGTKGARGARGVRGVRGYSTNDGPGVGASDPSTPNLTVEVSSDVATPCLTTEQNSPESTSPPSTSISITDDTSERTVQVPRLAKELAPVQVEEQAEEN